MQVVAEGDKGCDRASVGSQTGGGTEGAITWQMQTGGGTQGIITWQRDGWSEEGWLVKVWNAWKRILSQKKVGDQSPHSDSP